MNRIHPQKIPGVLSSFLIVLLLITATIHGQDVQSRQPMLPDDTIRAYHPATTSQNIPFYLTIDGQVHQPGKPVLPGIETVRPGAIRLTEESYIVRQLPADGFAYGSKGKITWEIRDFKGGIVGNISHPFIGDAPLPTLYASESGRRFTVIDPWEFTVHWYSATEHLQDIHLPAEDAIHSSEPRITGSWNPQGTRFLVAANYNGPGEDGTESTVTLFTGDGEQIMQRTLPLEYPGSVVMDSAREITMVSGHSYPDGELTKRYYLLNSAGEIVHTGDGLAIGASFRTESGGVVWGRRFVHYYENLAEAPVWTEHFPGEKKTMCLEAIPLNGGGIALLRGTSTPKGGEYVFQDPVLFVYNGDGELIRELAFPDEVMYEPFMKYVIDQNHIILGTSERLHTIAVD